MKKLSTLVLAAAALVLTGQVAKADITVATAGPMTGQYDIYVGTYGNASYQNATLSISELRSY